MEAKKILQSDVLDIIFDQRNKAYGAYELRKNYHKRARNAIVFTIIFVSMIVSAPLVAGLLRTQPPLLPPITETPRVIKDIPVSLNHPEPPAVNTHVKVDPQPTIPIVIAHVIKDPLPQDPEVITPPSPAGPEGPEVLGPLNPTVSGGGTPKEGGIVETAKEPEIIFTTEMDLQQYPEFPGGEEALTAYLVKHIQYPSRALQNDIEGHVTLGFLVNKDGEIEDIKVIRSLGYGCDDEALRVAGAMPKWKPGKNNGKAVKVYFNLPINFVLNKQ